jgi:hypothetical protein
LLRDPKHKEIWTKAGANEFGRLAQGVGGRMDGTNTIFFIHKKEIPQDRLKDVTYIKFVASFAQKKMSPTASEPLSAATSSTIPTMWVPQLPIYC